MFGKFVVSVVVALGLVVLGSTPAAAAKNG